MDFGMKTTILIKPSIILYIGYMSDICNKANQLKIQREIMILIVNRPASIDIGGIATPSQYGGRVDVSLQWTV